MKCISCNYEEPEEFLFCPTCGVKQVAASAPPALPGIGAGSGKVKPHTAPKGKIVKIERQKTHTKPAAPKITSEVKEKKQEVHLPIPGSQNLAAEFLEVMRDPDKMLRAYAGQYENPVICAMVRDMVNKRSK